MATSAFGPALTACLICGTSGAIAQPGRYRADPEASPFIGVPYEPGANNTLREVTAINSSGDLCLWQTKASTTVGNIRRYIQGAYCWTGPAGLVLLSDNKATADSAYDIDDHGVTVGAAWNGTTMQAAVLGPTTAPALISTFGAGSTALAVNNRGDVVGWYVSSTVQHAFLKAAGADTVDLGSLAGGSSVATDINDAGRIVGYSGDSPVRKAFRLDMGGPMVDINRDFSVYPGCFLTRAVKVSPSGLIAAQDICGGAWVIDPPDADHAVSLGLLEGCIARVVVSVNDSRVAVGYQSPTPLPAGAPVACKWEADGTAVSLYERTVNRPAAGFSRAMDINAAGQIAVFSVAGGYNRIFRLTPLCNADFNGDGFIDGIDIDTFENAFAIGSQSVDMNQDGFVDGADHDLWYNWLEGQAGCP